MSHIGQLSQENFLHHSVTLTFAEKISLTCIFPIQISGPQSYEQEEREQLISPHFHNPNSLFNKHHL